MAKLNILKLRHLVPVRTHESAPAKAISALVRVPSRRGFALRDAIASSQPHGGTQLGIAVRGLRGDYDRLVVITDEQSHDRVPAPSGKG